MVKTEKFSQMTLDINNNTNTNNQTVSDKTVLELKVNNHPGVMSHVTGLFARRAYNLDGILCGPVGNSNYSVMYLLVNKNNQIDQVISQLKKLQDVMEIHQRDNYRKEIFYDLSSLVNT